MLVRELFSATTVAVVAVVVVVVLHSKLVFRGDVRGNFQLDILFLFAQLNSFVVTQTRNNNSDTP